MTTATFKAREPMDCGKRELHVLFTRIATLIEENIDGDDFVDSEVEPIIEAFIGDYYPDVEPRVHGHGVRYPRRLSPQRTHRDLIFGC
jgi:hypothetical protein